MINTTVWGECNFIAINQDIPKLVFYVCTVPLLPRNFFFLCMATNRASVAFQVLDEAKLQQVDSLYKEFETPEKANKM